MKVLTESQLQNDWGLTELLRQVLLTTTHEDENDTSRQVVWDDETTSYEYTNRGPRATKSPSRTTSRRSTSTNSSNFNGNIDPITGVSLRKDSWYSRGHGAGRTGKPFSSRPSAPAGHEWLEKVWEQGWGAGRAKGMLEGKTYYN